VAGDRRAGREHDLDAANAPTGFDPAAQACTTAQTLSMRGDEEGLSDVRQCEAALCIACAQSYRFVGWNSPTTARPSRPRWYAIGVDDGAAERPTTVDAHDSTVAPSKHSNST
jgi:hypothetical protein